MALPASIAELLAQTEADPRLRPEAILRMLLRLLAAPAPANSCLLPGTVGECIRTLADDLGLDCAPIGSSGNLGIALGADSAGYDLLVCAHMDRPCFRVLHLGTAALYPLCALRVPGGGYSCAGMALRYDGGRVGVVARGQLHFSGQQIQFEVLQGQLRWGDCVMMAGSPRVERGQLLATGLDNAVGLLLCLLAAYSLARVGGWGGRIVFACTDQEEGPPTGLFGQGAARLAAALPAPRLGFVNVDGHSPDAALGQDIGLGASHAFVSGSGRGAVVPLDWQARTEALAAAVNAARASTVALNYSYVSRSDDMLLSTWARCLGLCGVLLAHAHTTEETVALGDIVAATRWLPAFLMEALRGDS